MKTFRFDEIQNKHGQRIYMFSNQNGNTELEKCLNSLKNNKYKLFEINTPQNQVVKIVAEQGCFQVFNDKEEKIDECDFGGTDLVNSVDDIADYLCDLGYME